ncbi:MAG: T9SS type A sorting domain-containing protein [Bacteroidetes bacterium]|nr:T9SS type A sorting domain-containing protein [Bacteroidota bacterium]MBS1944502.1 T9SS type A sorting domain-containing protein [Bacteroidota bacterium]
MPPPNYDWLPLDGAPNGPVRVLLTDASSFLCFAGGFSEALGMAVQNVAFPGISPGSGITGTITCGVLMGNGDIYLGGSGLNGINDLAHWDGSQWTYMTVFQGKSPQITALCVHQGVLYAAGITSGFVGNDYSVQALAGGTWHQVGDKFNNTVKALGSFGNKLVAGGDFTATIGLVIVETAHVAVLESAGWFPLGNGLDGAVNAFATDLFGTLYAGGTMYEDGVPRFGLARISAGSADWEPLMPSLPGYIDASPGPVEIRALLVDYSNKVYVGGSFHITHGTMEGRHLAYFTGTADDFIPAGLFNGPVNALVTNYGISDAFGLIAGGEFTMQEGDDVPYLAWAMGIITSVRGNSREVGLRLHPNPANDRLSVEWDQNAAVPGRLSVVDAQGRTVLSQGTTGGSGIIDVSSLAPGSYRLLFSTGSHRQVLPFIKR